jgi:hypothetical protein
MKTTLASRRWGNAPQYTIVPEESKHPRESLGREESQEEAREFGLSRGRQVTLDLTLRGKPMRPIISPF